MRISIPDQGYARSQGRDTRQDGGCIVLARGACLSRIMNDSKEGEGYPSTVTSLRYQHHLLPSAWTKGKRPAVNARTCVAQSQSRECKPRRAGCRDTPESESPGIGNRRQSGSTYTIHDLSAQHQQYRNSISLSKSTSTFVSNEAILNRNLMGLVPDPPASVPAPVTRRDRVKALLRISSYWPGFPIPRRSTELGTVAELKNDSFLIGLAIHRLWISVADSLLEGFSCHVRSTAEKETTGGCFELLMRRFPPRRRKSANRLKGPCSGYVRCSQTHGLRLVCGQQCGTSLESHPHAANESQMNDIVP